MKHLCLKPTLWTVKNYASNNTDTINLIYVQKQQKWKEHES